ncbi:MAG: hypothetical protein O7F15_05765 [Gammaproteobacteria bacterium]|nr:hypothetical protein [Gammaproteobacteria bacterium]MCZ6578593.1 hypothetical protein [Gammaproteobacteria bacterium]MCZ6668426.1 hypothetical protein [Gammaproteobacteria bacterium]MCZ6882500.1 hypothetical protein [Gammaproteobacteria bacterium]
MKIFFSLLLIANIAFGLMQWLLPYDQLFQKNKKFPVAEELRLLDEPIESSLITETGVSEPEQAGELLVVEETIDTRLCYTIGPFKDRTRALEVSRRYSNRQVKTELKSSPEKEYLGVMVYLTGNKSRQDAIDTAEELATKGFRDYLIINEPGKSNALSLGVFGLKKNADRHVTRLKKLNYPAKSEPRYRERTIYWVYNEQSIDRDLLTLLDADDAANGIGQIPQQCS